MVVNLIQPHVTIMVRRIVGQSPIIQAKWKCKLLSFEKKNGPIERRPHLTLILSLIEEIDREAPAK